MVWVKTIVICIFEYIFGVFVDSGEEVIKFLDIIMELLYNWFANRIKWHVEHIIIYWIYFMVEHRWIRIFFELLFKSSGEDITLDLYNI